MKWHSFILLLCLPLLSACGILQRTKTITKTITEIKVDTIIKVKTDTIKIVKTEPLNNFINGDTIKAESSTSVARAYYNIKTEKVELSLTGKNFNVPVIIKSHVIERKKEIKQTGMPFYFWILLGIVVYLITIVLFIIFKKL